VLFRRPGTNLRRVAAQLEGALNRAGYAERSFFCVKNGFAIATRLERIHPVTKAPLPRPRRWETGNAALLDASDGFSLTKIVEALLTADPGRYRTIIFYVTDQAVQPTSKEATPGDPVFDPSPHDELPTTFSRFPYTSRHRVKALIYEFRRTAVTSAPSLVRETQPADTHLRAARILHYLQKG
jgi:hypothetical protein